MEIWLKNDNYNIRFPVLPSSYSVEYELNNTSVNINAVGEVNLVGKRNLAKVEFSTIFPRDKDTTYCDVAPQYNPEGYFSVFKKMQESGVCKLTMTECLSMNCTIESLSASEEDGSGDLAISFSFKEYRKMNVGTSKLARPTKKTTTKTKTYKTKKGDSLNTIAKKLTGKTSNWKKIYQDNKKVIGSKSSKLKAGLLLKIRSKY